MTEEAIMDVLPSIAVARLFYTYGRLNTLTECDFEKADSGFYEMFWELVEAIPDFASCDYNEDFGVTKWYFSFADMMEYYRLCRVYGRLRRLALKDNPFMKDARQFVEHAMDLDNYYGYAWTLQTRVNHNWASGIVFRIDEEFFNGELDLLGALLSIADWYKWHLEQLRQAIEEEKGRAEGCVEVKAA